MNRITNKFSMHINLEIKSEQNNSQAFSKGDFSASFLSVFVQYSLFSPYWLLLHDLSFYTEFPFDIAQEMFPVRIRQINIRIPQTKFSKTIWYLPCGTGLLKFWQAWDNLYLLFCFCNFWNRIKLLPPLSYFSTAL